MCFACEPGVCCGSSPARSPWPWDSTGKCPNCTGQSPGVPSSSELPGPPGFPLLWPIHVEQSGGLPESAGAQVPPASRCSVCAEPTHLPLRTLNRVWMTQNTQCEMEMLWTQLSVVLLSATTAMEQLEESRTLVQSQGFSPGCCPPAVG